uniref:RING-type domain-containing protein n=1 Tax=Trametes gibbosa TaxID=160864 RepID=A0A6G6FQU2_9APHY|nr:hypothetical protein [Trametes gibbosa]
MTDAFNMLRNPEAAALARGDLMGMLERARQREARLDAFASTLPKVTEGELASLGQSDSTCPICLTPLLALLAEEETALAMDSPAHPVEELGITRLAQTCGHIFCRKDIRGWLYQGNTTCPTCRRPFITLAPEDTGTGVDADAAGQAALFDDLITAALATPPQFDEYHPIFGSPQGPRRENLEDAAQPAHDQQQRDAHFDYDDDRSAFSGMYS